MSVGAAEGLAPPAEAPGCGTSARPSGRVEDCSVVGALGAGMFGVGTTEGIVVGGMSGGPSGARAGAKGAAVVTTEGAGAVLTTDTWTESTTAITITANTALTASTAYTVKYWCGGN